MVNAIVTLARNLDLAVVAGGTEQPSQRAELIRMGCPYGQEVPLLQAGLAPQDTFPEQE